jgi:NAD-specific glutamate dehydrogenase
VLSSHVKLAVFEQLMEDDSDLIPGFDEKVRNYFPARIRKEFADAIPSHMLYKSIGMTVATTEVTGDTGALYFPTLMELTGVSPAVCAKAWYRAFGLVGGERIRRDLEACDAPLESQYKAWVAVTDAILGIVSLWLTPGEPSVTDEDLSAIRDVLTHLGRLHGTAHEAALRARAEAHIGRDIPPSLANRIALIGEATVAHEINRVHRSRRKLVNSITRYLAIGEASRILPVIRALETRRARGGWDPVATGILRNRYVMLLRQLCDAVAVGPEVRLGVDRLAVRLGRGVLSELQAEMDRVLGGEQQNLAALLVAEERVRARLAETEQRPRAAATGK